MLVEYSYPVLGHAKIGRIHDFSLRGRDYQLRVDESGFLCEVSVRLQVDGDSCLPALNESKDPDVEGHVTLPLHPDFSLIRQEMRALEGLLALHGLREIGTENVRTTWIPENEQESKSLKITSFTMNSGDMRNHPHEPIDAEILARSLIAAPNAYESELPMSFYRKGCIDVEQLRFIDAIYDFYFCIETLYADGHTKNYRVKEG